MERIPLLEADSLDITVLVDNSIDALLGGDEQVKRKGWAKAIHNPLIDAPEVLTSMVAEHGFSALVTLRRADRVHRLLFDAGLSPNGLVANMDRLEVNPKDIEAVVLSHGHFDHTGGLQGLTDRLGKVAMPMIVHPRAYTKRRSNPPGGQPTPLPPPSRSALEGAGFELVESEEPSAILDGALLVTGEIPRQVSFEQGFPFFEAEVDGRWEPEPHLMDDQGIVVNVRGRGLVVMTGCGHSGIVNIVQRAKDLTGVDKIAGVLGGFHMPGPFFEPLIPLTVDALRSMDPAMVVPGHCTGWKAQMALAAAMPEAFVPNAVGSTYSF